MQRSGQQWISDVMVASLGLDLVFPDAYIGWLEQGMKLQDYRRTADKIRTAAMISKSWILTADDLVQKANASEELGHYESALEFYHRASFAYGKAFWADKTSATHARLKDSYTKALNYVTNAVRLVKIPFGNQYIYGVLHLPFDIREPVPVVIFVPGMDMIKEDYPHLAENRFAKRGIACLAIDGPGQGESWLHGLYVNADNYADAGSAVIDFIEGQPELDSTRIGVFGCSMGSYWAPTIAAKDKRVKACAAAMGCYLQKHTIFHLAAPAFRHNFMVMSNVFDDKAFDEMAEEMTLARFAPDIECPILLAHGEFDQLCPLSDARELFAMLTCPRELWVFENELHALGRQRGEMFAWTADWLRDKVNGRYTRDLVSERWIAEVG